MLRGGAPDLDGEPIDVMGLIAVVEHPEGFVPFAAVRTDLPDRELALFCRAAAIRFERLHDVGPEADGWIVRRNGKGIEMTIGWSDMPALDD